MHAYHSVAHRFLSANTPPLWWVVISLFYWPQQKHSPDAASGAAEKNGLLYSTGKKIDNSNSNWTLS